MIKRFLEWALSKLEHQPSSKEMLKEHLFPVETKRKPRVSKATTRPKAAKTVAKKTTKVTKKAT